MEFSMEGLAIPLSNKKNPKAVAEVTRRSANYHPSIWGDRFLAYSPSNATTELDLKMEQQHQELKETVRYMLVKYVDEPSHKLNFIDAIQRLGVSYHFENEIETTLRKIHETAYHNNHYKAGGDLYTISLKFRLLRQEGYHVSCDAFKKFKDSNGKFIESLTSDAQGMLSLYEAAHFRVKGEDILDEALDFCTTQLDLLAPKLSNPLKAQVTHALKQPIRMGLTRLEARAYIPLYEEEDSHDQTLLHFAKLDFNLLQKLHQKELSEITRWWKDLDFANKLPFARDRMVECYFWILGVYFEPQYVLARRILTKVIVLASTIDDIYDVYGTLQELELFTDAIDRWDINVIDSLPEYMRFCYQALLDTYSVIEEGKAHYATTAMKNLVKAYFNESKWYHEDYVPTFEEYMIVGLVTSGYPMLATLSFVVGDMVSKEAIEWASTHSLISRASSLIARLMDDMAGHKFEQKRGDVASAVECYMKQYRVSEEEANLELRKQVTNAWKDINAECLLPTKVPRAPLMRIDNLARVIDVLYKDEDCYTNSTTKVKDFITSVLIDPVPIPPGK